MPSHAMTLRVLAAAFACAYCTAAGAQSLPNAQQMEQLKAQMIQRFAHADADRDGRLTKAEAAGKMPRLHANFEAVDGDGDGYVSQQDIIDYVQQLAQQRR